MDTDYGQEHVDALPYGTILRDYIVQQVIGQGGFGITYLAHDTVFERDVAIKEFLPGDIARRFSDVRVGPRASKFGANFTWGLKEFVQEARLIDQLDHPNVVRVRAFFRENNTAYLVMEHVPGPTLAAYLSEYGTLEAPALLTLLRPLVAGLAHVHTHQCLHRDLKPNNI